MKTALFTNFSAFEYIGYWNGKPHIFPPGKSKYMPEYLARHFAKHLVNRELLRDANQNAGLERCTSPKKPEDVPEFMDRWHKAFKIEDDGEEMEFADTRDTAEIHMEMAEKSHGAKEPQMIEGPADDEDGEDGFEGKPNETETINKQPGAKNGATEGQNKK